MDLFDVVFQRVLRHKLLFAQRAFCHLRIFEKKTFHAKSRTTKETVWPDCTGNRLVLMDKPWKGHQLAALSSLNFCSLFKFLKRLYRQS
jgi:hypothetical protein